MFENLFPLPTTQKDALVKLKVLLDIDRYAVIERLVKSKTCAIVFAQRGLSIVSDKPYAQLQKIQDVEISQLDEINQILLETSNHELYKQFAPNALQTLIKAYNTPNFDVITKLLVIQLACPDQFHLLLVNDETSNTDDFLKTSATLSPNGSAQKAPIAEALGITLYGEEVKKGLLIKLHQGLLAIQSIENEPELTQIFSAMDHGVIQFTKDDASHTVQAGVKVLALTHPKNNIFAARTLEQMKSQLAIPHDAMDHFHLVCILREKTKTQLTQTVTTPITVNTADTTFIQDFLLWVEQHDVVFGQEFHKPVVDFVTKLKERESQYIMPIHAKLAQAIIRISMTHARLHLRDVQSSDVKFAMDLVQTIVEAV
jgi:hypothetical protein